MIMTEERQDREQAQCERPKNQFTLFEDYMVGDAGLELDRPPGRAAAMAGTITIRCTDGDYIHGRYDRYNTDEVGELYEPFIRLAESLPRSILAGSEINLFPYLRTR